MLNYQRVHDFWPPEPKTFSWDMDKWLNSMVYGRYNELVNGAYKPTYNWGYTMIYTLIYNGEQYSWNMGHSYDLTHHETYNFTVIQCGAPQTIAKLVDSSNFTMVYDTYNDSIHRVFCSPTNIAFVGPTLVCCGHPQPTGRLTSFSFFFAKNMDHNHNQQQMLLFCGLWKIGHEDISPSSISGWWFGRFIIFPFSWE